MGSDADKTLNKLCYLPLLIYNTEVSYDKQGCICLIKNTEYSSLQCHMILQKLLLRLAWLTMLSVCDWVNVRQCVKRFGGHWVCENAV